MKLPVMSVVVLVSVGLVAPSAAAPEQFPYRLEYWAADSTIESTRTATDDRSGLAPPWLYLDDPSQPGKLRALAVSRAGYTSMGATPTRPFGANVALPGATVELGGALGVTSWLAATATVFGSPEANSIGMMAGLRLDPFAHRWATTHASITAGFLRELEGSNGVYSRLAITQDIQRVRIGLTVHGEHVFVRGRDAVDVMVMTGADVRFMGPLRLGAEYVVQDVEGAADAEEAEAGLRHFAGPTLGLDLFEHRLALTTGPSLGLSPSTPRLSMRLAMTLAF